MLFWEFFSNSVQGFSFRDARKMCGRFPRQPSEMTHLPFTVKEWSPQSKVAVTAHTHTASPMHSSLQHTNRNKLRSPKGRALISAFSISSWFVARFAQRQQRQPHPGRGQFSMALIPRWSLFNYTISWRNTSGLSPKLAPVARATSKSILTDASKLADEYRARLTEQENVSLLPDAFYPVERVVLDIPLKIKEKHSFRQLDGYDNSLSQGVDFRRFFEWFREPGR